jgi:hypothetical protein
VQRTPPVAVAAAEAMDALRQREPELIQRFSSKLIGSEGGELCLPLCAKLIVPRGALDEDDACVFQLRLRCPQGEDPPPSATVECLPDGRDFLVPVELQLFTGLPLDGIDPGLVQATVVSRSRGRSEDVHVELRDSPSGAVAVFSMPHFTDANFTYPESAGKPAQCSFACIYDVPVACRKNRVDFKYASCDTSRATVQAKALDPGGKALIWYHCQLPVVTSPVVLQPSFRAGDDQKWATVPAHPSLVLVSCGGELILASAGGGFSVVPLPHVHFSLGAES